MRKILSTAAMLIACLYAGAQTAEPEFEWEKEAQKPGANFYQIRQKYNKKFNPHCS